MKLSLFARKPSFRNFSRLVAMPGDFFPQELNVELQQLVEYPCALRT